MPQAAQPCIITVANDDLREWVASEARSLLARGNRPDRHWMGTLAIPDDPAVAATLVRRLREGAAEHELAEALDAIDETVANAFGLTAEQLSHIHQAFSSDAMLQHVRPQWKHRRMIVPGAAVMDDG